MPRREREMDTDRERGGGVLKDSSRSISRQKQRGETGGLYLSHYFCNYKATSLKPQERQNRLYEISVVATKEALWGFIFNLHAENETPQIASFVIVI